MDKEFIKQLLISKKLPKLKDDKQFQISSPVNPNYNCIAWAYQLIDNKWYATPRGSLQFDGVISFWPDDIPDGRDISCLVALFESIGYVRCNTYEHESGFQKVALYWKEYSQEWTHASRESRDGSFWMSKLGPSVDIHHGNPYSVEGTDYGTVYCIMKRPS